MVVEHGLAKYMCARKVKVFILIVFKKYSYRSIRLSCNNLRGGRTIILDVGGGQRERKSDSAVSIAGRVAIVVRLALVNDQ